MPLERVKLFLKPFPDLKIILFDQSTHTSELAAEALGVKPAQIAKTLVFVADTQPLLVVTCGDKKINTKKLTKILGVKKVRFADEETVAASTGFSPDGVSPIGLVKEVPLYLTRVSGTLILFMQLRGQLILHCQLARIVCVKLLRQRSLTFAAKSPSRQSCA